MSSWRTAGLAIFGLVLSLALSPPARAQDPGEDLRRAASAGDAARVKELLAAGVDVNSANRYGGTALAFACDRGHLEVVKLLLDNGANPNTTDSFYQATPAAWAAMKGHVEILRALLEKGAEGEKQALMFAAHGGDKEIVQLILERGKVGPDALSEALAAADQAGNKEVSELLRAKGGQPPPAAAAAVRPGESWPSFRGPQASGVAEGATPPTTWNAETAANVRWKTAIPGLANSSPVVWGDRVFVTTAVSAEKDPVYRMGLYGEVDSVETKAEHSFRVYSLDRATGKVLWERVAFTGVPKVKRHLKSTHANPTPATDGQRLVVSFGSQGLYCYDFDGKLLWQTDLGVLDSGWFYDPSYQWEFGSSPVIWKDLVIVQADVQKSSFLAAFNLKDGEEAWRVQRDEIPSWATPTVFEGERGPELVTNGNPRIRGYDPATGEELWRLVGSSEIVAPTPIGAHGMVYVTSGYAPVQPIYAIRLGARGDLTLPEGQEASEQVAWSKKRGGPYMPTPILYGDHLYTLANNGILTVYDARTGEQVYKERVAGTKSTSFSASPVAADGRLYFASEEGDVYVVKAGPKLELLATNPLGEALMASPALSGDLLIVRGRSHLFALGEQPAAEAGK